MANEKQLAILKKGTEVWNKWRKKNYTIVVDLRGAVLSDANLIDKSNKQRTNRIVAVAIQKSIFENA